MVGGGWIHGSRGAEREEQAIEIFSRKMCGILSG